MLAEVGRESSEAAIRTEEANAWTLRVEELSDGEALAASAEALKRRIGELHNTYVLHYIGY